MWAERTGEGLAAFSTQALGDLPNAAPTIVTAIQEAGLPKVSCMQNRPVTWYLKQNHCSTCNSEVLRQTPLTDSLQCAHTMLNAELLSAQPWNCAFSGHRMKGDVMLDGVLLL